MEEKKLGEVVKFYSGLTYTPDDISNGGTLVLRSSNIQANRLTFNDNLFVNTEVAKSEEVQVGDIIVVVRNSSRNLIEKHALIKSNLPNTVIGAFMTGIRAKNYNFISATLDHANFKREIHKNLGATINQFTTGDFKKMRFRFPTDEEQEAIGKFFSSIDSLMSSYQEKIGQLEILKKKLLQEIFI